MYKLYKYKQCIAEDPGAELTRKEGRTKDDLKDEKLIGGLGSVARLRG